MVVLLFFPMILRQCPWFFMVFPRIVPYVPTDSQEDLWQPKKAPWKNAITGTSRSGGNLRPEGFSKKDPKHLWLLRRLKNLFQMIFTPQIIWVHDINHNDPPTSKVRSFWDSHHSYSHHSQWPPWRPASLERKDFRRRLMRSWSLHPPENLVILVWPIPTVNGLV